MNGVMLLFAAAACILALIIVRERRGNPLSSTWIAWLAAAAGVIAVALWVAAALMD